MKDPNQVITKRKDGSIDVGTRNVEPSKTQQQFKDECDINNIVKRFADTGEFRHLTSKEGTYADFSQITDYQDMLDTVIYAKNAFSSLPAEVRKRFGNDPGLLLQFLQDPNNREEGEKLGLINKRDLPKNDDLTTNKNKNAIKTKTPKTPPPELDESSDS